MVERSTCAELSRVFSAFLSAGAARCRQLGTMAAAAGDGSGSSTHAKAAVSAAGSSSGGAVGLHNNRLAAHFNSHHE
jgi:hypothetical protein